jgi:glycosyltransferase involved in cell wall biosynthesis
MRKVSVLMPTYNYARYLPLAIKSVLSQSYSDFELIIVDDCSTDGSKELVEEWKLSDDRVVAVYHDKNRGVAEARNSGLAVSSGEFIAFCDSDDVWLEDKLRVQFDALSKAPEVGILHSDSAIIDCIGNLTGERFSALYHRKNQPLSGALLEELCQRNFLCVPTVILRREAIKFAGGFDVSLRSLEDWVCWTKISSKYSFSYIDEVLAHYRIHGESLSSNSKNLAHSRIEALRILFDTISGICPKLRAKMLYSLGMSFLEIGDPAGAAKAFFDSTHADPFEGRSWVRYGQSALLLAAQKMGLA